MVLKSHIYIYRDNSPMKAETMLVDDTNSQKKHGVDSHYIYDHM